MVPEAVQGLVDVGPGALPILKRPKSDLLTSRLRVVPHPYSLGPNHSHTNLLNEYTIGFQRI